MNKIKTLLIFWVVTLSYMISTTAKAEEGLNIESETVISDSINKFISEENAYTFYGLASYYNTVNYFLVDSDSLYRLVPDVNVVLSGEEWLVVVSHFSVLAIRAPGLEVSLHDGKLNTNSASLFAIIDIKKISKSVLSEISPEFDRIRYNHLWKPLGSLARGVEYILVLIQTNIVESWGWTVVVFTILLKLLLLPVGVMTVKLQRTVSQVQSRLAPQLSDIKASYDGEEAHNRIMAAHKELGVSTFYSLKPMLALFIQIPILIAVFNALGEMPQFNQQSFFWINSLGHPDVIGHFPMALLVFGSAVSILPILMTIVTIFSTIIFQNSHASTAEVKRQKRNLYLMAAAFLVLFYPFPAVMVLYWTLNNALHIVQQKLIKV